MEERERKQNQYPDMSFEEISNLISEEWKTLSSEKKKNFEEMSKRYEKEVEAHTRALL